MAQFDDIRQIITDNRSEVLAILDTERLSTANSAELKILHAKYLVDFWKNRPQPRLFFVISLGEDNIAKLAFDKVQQALSETISEQLKTHNVINVDGDFQVISASNERLAEDTILELSNQGNIIFFFGEDGIDVGVRGKIIDRLNVFYNEEDRLAYSKKFHISQLQACLKDYERFIREPGNNETFFASMITVRRIRPQNTPNNTLVNSPESRLRDNLLSFLNRNTQHTFSKENELNNRRELDLYTEVDGKKYMVEVKWLGQCVNQAETDLTAKVTDVAARDGVVQTLEYIRELIENMGYLLHCGYLCVFDARDVKRQIDYRNFDFIADELLPFYRSHFKKLEEIILDRNH